MGFIIRSNILERTNSIFNSAAGRSLLRMFFLPVEWRDLIRRNHKSFKSDSNNPVHFTKNASLFVHLGDLYMHVYLAVVAILAVPLRVGILFIDNLFKGIHTMNLYIAPVGCGKSGLFHEQATVVPPT